jgi:hypothetical protein
VRCMAGAFEQHELASGLFGKGDAPARGDDCVGFTMDDQNGAADASREFP